MSLNIRQLIASALGQSFNGQRDIYEAAGFTKNPTFDTYYQKYRRGVGGTIIELMPKLCFSQFPDIKVNENIDEHATELFKSKINYNLLKADKLSGINNYSILFLGFNDNNDLDTQVENATELLFTSVYMESQVSISAYDTDTKSLNFGRPLLYNIQNTSAGNSTSLIVHYSRVLHLAENPTCVDYLGTPRLERILNNLDNIDKMIGASGESYWKNSTNGIAFIADKDTELNEESREKMSAEIDDYEHGLSRFLKLRGIEPKKLENSPVSPKEYIDNEFKLIAGIIEVPMRLLVGSENARVASITDDKNMECKVQNRRDQYVTPYLYQPLFEKLKAANVIEDKQYIIDWKLTNNLSESETVKNNLIRATIVEKISKLENNILTDDEMKDLIK